MYLKLKFVLIYKVSIIKKYVGTLYHVRVILILATYIYKIYQHINYNSIIINNKIKKLQIINDSFPRL